MRFSTVKVKPGRIYILRNPLHQDALVKIGYTQGASEERSSDLSKPTGVPYPFEVMYEEDVADCELAERLIHQSLFSYRSNPRREFFQLPLKLAVRTVFEICLRVNSELIAEKSRLSIWLNKSGLTAASELKNYCSHIEAEIPVFI